MNKIIRDLPATFKCHVLEVDRFIIVSLMSINISQLINFIKRNCFLLL